MSLLIAEGASMSMRGEISPSTPLIYLHLCVCVCVFAFTLHPYTTEQLLYLLSFALLFLRLSQLKRSLPIEREWERRNRFHFALIFLFTLLSEFSFLSLSLSVRRFCPDDFADAEYIQVDWKHL